MITIVNYGLGNIQAFLNIYKRLNISVRIANNENLLAGATKLILPGVGSFDWAMKRLADSGMRARLDELVLLDKVPVLGVCVGMQMMATHSEEGVLPGLGWIDAEVKRFDVQNITQMTHLPHMGWNDIVSLNDDVLFKGIKFPRFYFLHSYYFKPRCESCCIASANYIGTFAAAVRSENIFGTQFHPEKSHASGIQLLKNFADV